MADVFLDLGAMIPVGHGDLNADDKSPKHPLGTMSFIRDGFGAIRIFQYIRNTSTVAFTQGALLERIAATTDASITTGSTTGWTKTGQTYGTYTGQPGAFYGQLAKIDTNGTSAGAAPEGELGIISSNTATAVNIDSRRPFTAAPPATSATRVINMTAVKLSVAGELALLMAGISVGGNGISDGNWGWAQNYGVCPDVKHKATTAIVASDPVIAGTGVVDVKASTTVESWIGWQIGTHNNPVTSNKSPIFVQLFGFVRPIT